MRGKLALAALGLLAAVGADAGQFARVVSDSEARTSLQITVSPRPNEIGKRGAVFVVLRDSRSPNPIAFYSGTRFTSDPEPAFDGELDEIAVLASLSGENPTGELSGFCAAVDSWSGGIPKGSHSVFDISVGYAIDDPSVTGTPDAPLEALRRALKDAERVADSSVRQNIAQLIAQREADLAAAVEDEQANRVANLLQKVLSKGTGFSKVFVRTCPEPKLY